MLCSPLADSIRKICDPAVLAEGNIFAFYPKRAKLAAGISEQCVQAAFFVPRFSFVMGIARGPWQQGNAAGIWRQVTEKSRFEDVVGYGCIDACPLHRSIIKNRCDAAGESRASLCKAPFGGSSPVMEPVLLVWAANSKPIGSRQMAKKRFSRRTKKALMHLWGKDRRTALPFMLKQAPEPDDQLERGRDQCGKKPENGSSYGAQRSDEPSYGVLYFW